MGNKNNKRRTYSRKHSYQKARILKAKVQQAIPGYAEEIRDDHCAIPSQCDEADAGESNVASEVIGIIETHDTSTDTERSASADGRNYSSSGCTEDTGIFTNESGISFRADIESETSVNNDELSESQSYCSDGVLSGTKESLCRGGHLGEHIPEEDMSSRSDQSATHTQNTPIYGDMNSFIKECLRKSTMAGRTIVDALYVFEQLFINLHEHSKSCRYPFQYLQLYNIQPEGMLRRYNFGCMHCGYVFEIWSEEKEPIDQMTLHESAVIGTLTSGVSYSNAQELFASMNLKFITSKTYVKYRNKITQVVEDVSWDSMRQAAEEEAELARANGNTRNDIPLVTVIVDGAWSKRSYAGGRYDALSGVAVIVGSRTGKVLFIGVRNKFCSIFCRAENLKEPAGPHTCYKNFDANAPSTAMEADIIVEGFKSSVEMHGLIFNVVIGDGDSSVYKKILDNDPYRDYGIHVEKYECKNHLYRRFCKTIADISNSRLNSTLQKGTIKPMRERVKASALKMRKHVEKKTLAYLQENWPEREKIEKLDGDITKMTPHFFGDHSRCPAGEDSCEKITLNEVPILRKVGMYDAIEKAVGRLAQNAKSLLKNVSTNPAEACHSIGNKVLGGRRVFYGARNSFELRQKCATVQFNTQDVMSKIHAHNDKSVPITIMILETKRQEQRDRTRRYRVAHKRYKKRHDNGSADTHYGQRCQQPDMSPEEFNLAKRRFLETLPQQQENRTEIEANTKMQRDSNEWFYYRKNRLTASNFGEICKMKEDTSCANNVKKILYGSRLVTKPILYGQENESKAVKLLAESIGKRIDPSGLFIDEKIAYLAATPDGLIGNDGIAEVKCLWSVRDSNLHDALMKNTQIRNIFAPNNLNKLNTSHKYYYQVQGQLHITRREYCMFGVMTNGDFKYIKVDRDDDFWNRKMEPLLTRFYEECLLPEIINSRVNRGMSIDDPPYILEAKERKAAEKLRKNAEKEKKATNKREMRTQNWNGNELLTETQSERIPTEQNNEISSDDYQRNNGRILHNTHMATDLATERVQFVHINDDGEFHTQEEFDAIIRMSIDAINRDQVILNVRSEQNLSLSDSIDLFLNFIERTTNLTIFFTSYYTYPQYIKPSTTQKDIQIIGGHTTNHWICIYFDDTKVKVYDSMNSLQLSEEDEHYISLRYPHVNDVEVIQVTQQPDATTRREKSMNFCSENPRKITVLSGKRGAK